jgi:hypothetical protein
LCLVVVIAFGFRAWQSSWAKTHTTEHQPSWFIFIFWTALLAWLLALFFGGYIYSYYAEGYYDISQLNVYGLPGTSIIGDAGVNSGADNATTARSMYTGSGFPVKEGWMSRGEVDPYSDRGYPSTIGPSSPLFGKGGVNPATSSGQQLMDAGAVFFAHGSYLDFTKAISFSSGSKYCVVPIVLGKPERADYDFWAVGIDCCDEHPRGNTFPTVAGEPQKFHCGDYNNPNARAGLRMMNTALRPYFRLAVEQAEAAYDIKAPHPLFFYWMEDPINGDGRSNGQLLGAASSNMFTTSAYQWGYGARIGLQHDGNFLGLWPFSASDFGFASSSSGAKTKLAVAHRLQSTGSILHFLLQLVLVVGASYSFSLLGGFTS